MTRLAKLYRALMKEQTGDAGYTLLELLVVLAILGLIIGIAAPQVIGYFGHSKSKAAEIQISNIAAALELYHLDTESYPTSEQGLKALIEKPADARKWAGPYLTRDDGIIDPWGHPYLYQPPAGDGRILIRSLGADGKPGGIDDDRDLSNQH
jgi:general secretion pathway protein G